MVTHPLPAWLEPPLQRLVARANEQRLPHALLFTGLAGVGKTLLARLLAQRLNCLQAEGIHPCNQCKHCHLFATEGYLDFYWLEPEAPGKALKIDAIRELTGRLHTTPQLGGYKIGVMVSADSLTQSAANALLKTLEEPAGDSLLMLVSDQPSALLPTIRSRCQEIKVNLPSRDVARDWLTQQAPDAPADALLDIAQGAPLAALEGWQNDALGQQQQLSNDLAALHGGQIAPVALAQQWAKSDVRQQILWCQHYLGACIRQICLAPAGIRPKHARHWFQVNDKLLAYKRAVVLQTNPNPQFLWEDILIDLARLDPPSSATGAS